MFDMKYTGYHWKSFVVFYIKYHMIKRGKQCAIEAHELTSIPPWCNSKTKSGPLNITEKKML